MTAATTTPIRPSLVALGITTALASLLGAYSLAQDSTTDLDSWDILETLVGWTFVGSGLYAWWHRPTNPLGRLIIAAGLLWLVGRALQQVDSAATFTTGIWLGDLWGVVFVWVLVSFPHGRVPSHLDRIAPLLTVLAVGPLELVWLLFWDPGQAPGNALLTWPNERTAGNIDTAQRVVVVAATVGLALVLARRWLMASRPLRRVLLPVLAGAAALVLGAVLNVLQKVDIAAPTVRWLLLLTFAAVPVAVVGSILRARLARAGVGDLVLDLRDDLPADRLRQALARALGDPSLEIAYWLKQDGYYADADGAPFDLVHSGQGRSTTLIDRNGDRIAAVIHDSSLDDEPELLSAVAATAAIALENAQLHAELRARLEDLQGMQRWASSAGALERKRLERDLHDGTQQRLVALSTELTLIERRAGANPELSAGLVHAREQVAASLAELRDVAHGRRPPELAADGFRAALRSVVAASQLETTLTVDVPSVLPEPVETSAYYVVCESLANIGRHAEAATVLVEVAQRASVLRVDICDDGVGGADVGGGTGLRGLNDRVEALGGRFEVHDAHGGGTHVHAEFPCA